MDNVSQDLCTIRIMFPVRTDEEAIEYKRKIGQVISSIPDAQIQFTLHTATPTPIGRPNAV